MKLIGMCVVYNGSDYKFHSHFYKQKMVVFIHFWTWPSQNFGLIDGLAKIVCVTVVVMSFFLLNKKMHSKKDCDRSNGKNEIIFRWFCSWWMDNINFSLSRRLFRWDDTFETFVIIEKFINVNDVLQ